MFCKVLLAMLGLCFAFEMKCPEPAQWPIRARLHCPNPSLYYCLLSIDGISRINVENCSKADFEAPGKRMVIRWNFDAFYCTNDKYQPIKYWTNVSSDCLFLTSTCREEGQVLHSIDKYHEYDTSCRCDYSNGYDFITRPMNPRFCIPTEEDCSCYKKKCSLVNSALPQDYKCTEEIQRGVDEVSAVSNITRFGTSDVTFTMLPEDKSNDHVHKGNNANIHTVYAVFVIITITTCICVMLICCGIEIDVLLDEYCRKVYFITQLKVTTECIEGEDQKLECRLSKSNMIVHWIKQNESLKPPHYITDATGQIYHLIIKNVNPNDEGQYVIKVKDIISSLDLKVKEYFTKNPEKNIKRTEGENLEILCEVLDTNATVVWRKDDDILQDSDKHKIHNDGRSHKLSIFKVKTKDSGNYSVEVNSRTRKTRLIIEEKPKKSLNEKDESLYLNNIQTQKEKRFYIRIIIIGEHGVGKTCLLRRLLKKGTDGIKDVKSTDGIDIERCQIRKDDGTWMCDEVTDKRKELIKRIKRSLECQTPEHDNSAVVKNKDGNVGKSFDSNFNMGTQKDDHQSTKDSLNEQRIKTKDKHTIRQTIEESNEQMGTQKDDHQSTKDSLNEQRIKTKNKHTIRQTIEESNEQVSLNLNQRPKEPFHSFQTAMEKEVHSDIVDNILNEKIMKDLSTFLIEMHNSEVSNEVLVDCGFWDFAGEKEYYRTHPIFLNQHALHLLVADINKDIGLIKTDNGFDQIGEYLEFWFDSIHSIGDFKTNDEKQLNPPVILVCTNIDQIKDEIEIRKRMEKFGSDVKGMLGLEKVKHLRRICCVSNIEPTEVEFEKLRKFIFDYGQEMQTYGEELPLKWIRLEQALDIVQEAGANVLSWSDITKLAYTCSFSYTDEINRFLKYQHKIGNIIYFEKLKDTIILNQKWLADAFKCLVSAHYNDDVYVAEEWTKLQNEGELGDNLITQLFQKVPKRNFIEHKDHILKVMEMFGIIFKPTTLTPEGKRQTLQMYYMPSMISLQSSVEDVKQKFYATQSKQSPWLCFQFKFMPLDVFNNIMREISCQYSVSTVPHTEPPKTALYLGLGVFNLDEFNNLVVCFSKNTISLQIWQWKNPVEKYKYKEILDLFKSWISRCQSKYESRNLIYEVKTKCCDGNIHTTDGRKSYKELAEKEDYSCTDHNRREIHKTKEFLETWFCSEKCAVQYKADVHEVHAVYDDLFGEVIRMNNKADFLAVYLPSPAYVRCLSEELLKMKKGEEIHKMLTRLNRRTATSHYESHYQNSNAVHMSHFVSHLTKELVLKE